MRFSRKSSARGRRKGGSSFLQKDKHRWQTYLSQSKGTSEC